jgi:hypothetical protein
MQKYFIGIFLISATVACSYAQINKTTAVAVMNLGGSGISESDAKFLTDRLTIELQRAGMFEVLERDKMDEILKEQGFQQTGACDETACLVEAGRLLPVQKMIGGSLGKIGDVFSAQLRLIDLKTGKVEKTSARDYKGQMEFLLTVGMKEVAEELSGKREIQAQTPVQTQATPQTEVMIRGMLEAQYDDKSKSKGWAVFWSMYPGFGVGNFYAKNKIAGSAFLVGNIAAMWGISNTQSSTESSARLAALLVVKVLECVVAYRSAGNYNKKLREKYGLTLDCNPQSQELKTALSVQF